jgi:hypothetical protein
MGICLWYRCLALKIHLNKEQLQEANKVLSISEYTRSRLIEEQGLRQKMFLYYQSALI